MQFTTIHTNFKRITLIIIARKHTNNITYGTLILLNKFIIIKDLLCACQITSILS